MQVPVLDDLNLQHLTWLVPLFFAIHNAEEAPQMARWTRRLPSGMHPEVSTPQFSLAVVLLTLLSVAAAGSVYLAPQSQVAWYALVVIQAGILVNALIPHLLATIRFRMYSPGLVTGMLINVPFSLYFFYRLLDERILGWTGLLVALAAAPVVMVGMAWGSLKLSARILPLLGFSSPTAEPTGATEHDSQGVE